MTQPTFNAQAVYTLVGIRANLFTEWRDSVAERGAAAPASLRLFDAWLKLTHAIFYLCAPHWRTA